jgi:hypothetical protein
MFLFDHHAVGITASTDLLGNGGLRDMGTHPPPPPKKKVGGHKIKKRDGGRKNIYGCVGVVLDLNHGPQSWADGGVAGE